jgi:hypothetical protein
MPNPDPTPRVYCFGTCPMCGVKVFSTSEDEDPDDWELDTLEDELDEDSEYDEWELDALMDEVDMESDYDECDEEVEAI